MSRYKVYTKDNSVYHTDVLDFERLGSEVMVFFVPKNGPTRGKKTFCFRENIELIQDNDADTVAASHNTEAADEIVWVLSPDGSIEVQGLPEAETIGAACGLEAILDMINAGQVVPMDAWEQWLLEDR